MRHSSTSSSQTFSFLPSVAFHVPALSRPVVSFGTQSFENGAVWSVVSSLFAWHRFKWDVTLRNEKECPSEVRPLVSWSKVHNTSTPLTQSPALFSSPSFCWSSSLWSIPFLSSSSSSSSSETDITWCEVSKDLPFESVTYRQSLTCR